MKKKLRSLFLGFALISSLLVPAISSEAATEKYAQPASQEELAAADHEVGSGGISFEIINGDLWVWGANRVGILGITSMTDPETGEEVEIKSGEVITTPVKIDKSVFGNSTVKKVYADWQSTMVINEANELYACGFNGNKEVAPQSDEKNIMQFTKVSFFEGMHVVEAGSNFRGNSFAKIKEADGTFSWYLWGMNSHGECATGNVEPVTSPYKINEDFIAGEKIVTVKQVDFATALLTESGKVYAVGSNDYGAIGNNWGRAASVPADAEEPAPVYDDVLIPQQVQLSTPIVELAQGYRAYYARDNQGRVWSWGSNGRANIGNGEMKGTLGERDSGVPKPVLVFGQGSANLNTVSKKAAKLFNTIDVGLVLCDDNSVFAWGKNNGGRIYAGAGWNEDPYVSVDSNICYPYPTQILEEISKKSTIVRITDDHLSFNVKTRAGDSFQTGDLEYQGGEALAPGEIGSVDKETLPPVKPTSKNKVYLDIVYTDRDRKELKTESGAAGSPVTANVDAGQKFTVKVYFEDFAKLDAFVLPIKFTNSRARIVYKSGSGDEEYKAYTGDANEPLDESNIPSFGSASGIQSNVKESVWPGGTLVKSDGYPRVNNKKGYFSVQGITTTNNAAITGKQLMFSIDFIGVDNGDITFSIMDAEATQISGDPTTTGGDPILAADGIGAKWTISRQLSGGTGEKELDSAFDFNSDFAAYFPTVNSMTHSLKSIALDFLFEKDGKQYKVTDKSTEKKAGDDTQTREYFTIDKENTENSYIVLAEPTPSNATNANIDSWTVSFDDFTGKNPTDKQVADYIQLVQTGTKTYTFRIPENTITTKDGYFTLTATKAGQTIAPIYIKVASMTPPEKIEITNGDQCPNPFLVNTEIPELNLDSSFPFEATVHDTANTGNTSVTWTLYNCVENSDGTITETAIANNDKSAPAVITETGETDATHKTASVQAQRSTPKGSYVKMKVVSTAGNTVYDETTFRVELLATGLIGNNTMYLGKNTSRQLNVSADPYDAFEPAFSVTLADDSTAAKSEHGSYISVGADGTISAGNEFYEGEEDIYDEVIITETKSDAYYKGLPDGNTKTVKRVRVYVLNILPPPGMDVEAQNNVGTFNDKVIYRADLKEGDKLTIYKEFMNHSGDSRVFPSLTASEIASLKEGFIFQDGLSGNGGTIGYLVERSGENFTEVPVGYTAEPCILTGYTRLEGKMPNSPQNKDITVEIMGLRDAEGNPIPAKTVQDETGYFEFENYVPTGTYTIKISRPLYMTRFITVTVTGQSSQSDIAVSTLDNPIYLAPGDLGNPKNGKLDPAEFQTYLYQWSGKVKSRSSDLRFDDYNFVEQSSTDNVIGIYDINLMLRYYNRDSIYKDWIVKQ